MIGICEKLSSTSFISYDSHTREAKEIVCCRFKSETSINNNSKETITMDYLSKRSVADKGYKNQNFLTGFHHKAYLDTVQMSHGKLKRNIFKDSNPMLPPIPYLRKKSRSPSCSRLKFFKHKDHQIVRVSRSTSPINLENDKDDIDSRTEVQNFPNDMTLSIEAQILCLDQIERELKPTHTKETFKSFDKRKEKFQNIPKDIPLQLLNISQRTRFKEGNENVELKKFCDDYKDANKTYGKALLEKLLANEENVESEVVSSHLRDDKEIQVQKDKEPQRRHENDKNEPNTTSKSSENINEYHQRSVLQQISYFNQKGKSNIEDITFLGEKNVRQPSKSSPNQVRRQYCRYRPNCKRNDEHLEVNTGFECRCDGDKKIKRNTPKVNRNYNRRSTENDLISITSSETTCSSESDRFDEHVRFSNRKLKKPYIQKNRFSNFNFEESTPKIHSSVIETIRSKFFENVNIAEKDKKRQITKLAEERNCDKLVLKFPKETRNAFRLLINNRNSKDLDVALTRELEEQQDLSKRPSKRHLYCYHHYQGDGENFKRHPKIETLSKSTYPKTNVNVFKQSGYIPCPKNLLCEKGVHTGKCGKLYEDRCVKRNMCSCSNCVCRKMSFWCPDWENIWPGSAKRYQQDDDNNKDEDMVENVKAPTSIGMKEKVFAIQNDEKVKMDRLEVLSPLRKTDPPKMNGMNGHHANGELNGCDIITQNQQKGCWTIGLINSKFRYLTAETFGFKINANGSSLKKKQIWTLEPDHANGGESYIYLRSHLDKYLAVDSFGNVTCESDEKDPGSKFQISVAEDGSGRWAFRNVVRGYFLGSSSDKLTCTAKVPGDAEFWHVHLAARPQVNLRSVGRKRFAHLSENLDEIHVDANIPWGEDTLFTLEFRADESGKYALHTCNNKYLSLGGKLVETCNKECLFTAEYHSGQLALRDRNGAYLSPIGSKAVLKTRSNTVTKDELFSLEDSLPQASFVAALNSRYVSVKQGVDVTANQDEISDHETFQLEFDWSTKRWYIRTMQDRYWTLETGGGIQAVGDKRSSNALFDLIWQGDGSVAFRANNGRYVITKRSGHLYATADTIDENCKYFFYLINRPILVLKSEQGFVGYKSASSPKLECNKATYETIQVERAEKGVIHFKGQNGKYWHCDSEGVTADSDTPEGFYLELREPTRLSIKSVNGSYLSASKNGTFRLGESSFEAATQWEY